MINFLYKQETGLTEEEIDRSLTWKRARKRKSGGYDADVAEIVEKIVSELIMLFIVFNTPISF